MYVGAHWCVQACVGGQRTTCWNWFSAFTSFDYHNCSRCIYPLSNPIDAENILVVVWTYYSFAQLSIEFFLLKMYDSVSPKTLAVIPFVFSALKNKGSNLSEFLCLFVLFFSPLWVIISSWKELVLAIVSSDIWPVEISFSWKRIQISLQLGQCSLKSSLLCFSLCSGLSSLLPTDLACCVSRNMFCLLSFYLWLCSSSALL